MKKLILFFISLILISCQEEKKVETENNAVVKIKDLAKSFKTDKLQKIEFTLKEDTLLIGNEGTKIFVPKDLFENYNKGKITLELKEFYSKEDMILNGLSTINDKDELLESSGMFYINFKEDTKQLNIKEGKNYKIDVKYKPLPNSNIYFNDNDSIFKWKLSNEKMFTEIPDIIRNYKFGLTNAEGGYYKSVLNENLSKVKRQDSLELLKLMQEDLRSVNSEIAIVEPNFNENDDILKDNALTENQKEERIKNRKSFFNTKNEIYNFASNKLGWINCDRLISPDKVADITISNLNKQLETNNYTIYFIYKDLKSLIVQNYNSLKSQKIYNFKIKNSIKAIACCNSNGKIYYDVFYINKNSKTNFDLNFKDTNLDNLKQELITP